MELCLGSDWLRRQRERLAFSGIYWITPQCVGGWCSTAWAAINLIGFLDIYIYSTTISSVWMGKLYPSSDIFNAFTEWGLGFLDDYRTLWFVPHFKYKSTLGRNHVDNTPHLSKNFQPKTHSLKSQCSNSSWNIGLTGSLMPAVILILIVPNRYIYFLGISLS